MENNNSPYTHVIGIDLGTKFSSVGYCSRESISEEKIVDIHQWGTDTQMNSFPKVPTIIAYHKTDPRKIKWGLTALNMTEEEKLEYDENIELFKLHLDEDYMNKPGEIVPILPEGMSAINVISDYLKELHEFVCKEMRKILGDDQDFNNKKSLFQYRLTVPVGWSERARNKMITASIAAGIITREEPPDRLVLISDLEATILNIEMAPDGIDISSGENVLICDIGGSTVDIAVFTKIVEGDKKILVEITERNVIFMRTSELLDDRMTELLNRKATPYAFGQERQDAMFSDFLNFFNTELKAVFGSNLTILLADRYNESTGCFKSGIDEFEIEPEMIEQLVFDHTLSEILDIMDDQIYQLTDRDLNLDYIVLTGGFIPNFYLFKSIKKRFGEKVKEIISPMNGAALTLSRGATYSVLLDPYDGVTHSPYLPPGLPDNKVLIMNTNEARISNDFIHNKRRFVTIGIDFGLTFSTASYLLTGEDKRAGEPLDITIWPKNPHSLRSKVPSAIRYHLNDPKIYKCGSEALYMSSHEQEEYGDVISQFKLYLDEDKSGDMLDPLPHGLTPLRVISDYLKYLHSNICLQIQLKSNYRSEGIMQRKFQYCLTVPAKWTSKAQMIMREAFTIAGMISRYDHFDRLVLVSELEAAAVYTENKVGVFKSGDILMICDAGAETLNLTTFKKNTFGGITKSLQEIVVSHETPFESEMLLEINFKNYIWKMMREFEYTIDQSTMAVLVEHFQDTVKPVLLEDDDNDEEEIFPFTLFLPGAEIEADGFYLDGERLEIQAKVLKSEVFDPVIEYVLSMIEYQMEQIENTELDYLILVGIFGQSKYLHRKIIEKFSDVVGDILFPKRAERAVVRGAVYHGLASL